jgi:hypothetical protein
MNDLPTEAKRIYANTLLNELINKENEIALEWVQHKKCECVDKVLEGHTLNCEHLNNEIKQRTKEMKDYTLKINREVLNEELIILRKQKEQETNSFELQDFII